MFQNKKITDKPPEEDINELLNHRHKRLMNILNLSSQFQQFLEEEFLEVCSKISNIGDESKRIYQLPFEVTSAKEFISNII
jgi:inositol 1,4,5-triphosphate receptor type 1/inositol 1,4,5-triphosphate receptor type 3